MISMRLRLLYRRLSYLTALLRDFRPGMQTSIPLSFKASLNQSASYPRSASGQPAFGRLRSRAAGPQGRCNHLACGHEEPDRPSFGIGNRVQLGVHATFGSPDLASAPPFSRTSSMPCGTP